MLSNEGLAAVGGCREALPRVLSGTTARALRLPHVAHQLVHFFVTQEVLGKSLGRRPLPGRPVTQTEGSPQASLWGLVHCCSEPHFFLQRGHASPGQTTAVASLGCQSISSCGLCSSPPSALHVPKGSDLCLTWQQTLPQHHVCSLLSERRI